jgi:DNA polymerase-3 subunit chi
MTDIMFYHLIDQPLEQALTELVEKSLQRNWHVVVHGNRQKRLEELDRHFWTYRADSFLPHALHNGTEDAETAQRQPVLLTDLPDNPNEAHIRFLIDQAEVDDAQAYERVVYMFDGLDADAVAHARGRWKAERDAGHALTYWQQDQTGRWEKKAST